MPAADKPAIVKEFLSRLGRLEIDAAAELLDDDCVMTFPYIEALPDIIGKAAIVAQIKATTAVMLDAMHFSFDSWFEATDGKTVITEYTSKCPIRGQDGFYENAYIGIFAFNGDRIALYKEYLNPAKLDLYAEQLGG